jgi:hypothetical protein
MRDHRSPFPGVCLPEHLGSGEPSGASIGPEPAEVTVALHQHPRRPSHRCREVRHSGIDGDNQVERGDRGGSVAERLQARGEVDDARRQVRGVLWIDHQAVPRDARNGQQRREIGQRHGPQAVVPVGVIPAVHQPDAQSIDFIERHRFRRRDVGLWREGVQQARQAPPVDVSSGRLKRQGALRKGQHVDRRDQPRQHASGGRSGHDREPVHARAKVLHVPPGEERIPMAIRAKQRQMGCMLAVPARHGAATRAEQSTSDPKVRRAIPLAIHRG